MTQIALKEPPARPANGRRPIMPLDARIMEIAGSTPMRPIQIARNLRAEEQYAGISTQRVASRLKSLVNRGMMIRIRPQGGPPNGPGPSLYRVKPEEGTASDG